MSIVYRFAKRFKSLYPATVAWRIKSHCKRVDEHLNPDEEVKYAFVGQRNMKFYDLFTTGVFVITNKRLIIATDRIFFGYTLYSLTPDMFNDLSVRAGILWGHIVIDTIKEEVHVSNLSKRSLDEVETMVTEYIMKAKKEYAHRDRAN